MTFQQEFSSWLTPSNPPPSPVPTPGSAAPSTHLLSISPSRPTIITFLRHCGCPFAEKTFLQIRDIAISNPDLDCVAVSHSDEAATQKWLESLPKDEAGDAKGKVRVVVDDKKEAYAAWGLGVSSWAHVLDPRALASVFQLAKEGLKNRPIESGSRWQTAGSYAVKDGKVVWGGPSQRSDDPAKFDEAVEVLKGKKQMERASL
ncbi:unnamed protein product [Zymoseptoria tritici ST99CH_3D1]|nr:unnamed protein product [Zymoseptoria tritici ST99CH_3D1]